MLKYFDIGILKGWIAGIIIVKCEWGNKKKREKASKDIVLFRVQIEDKLESECRNKIEEKWC